MTLIFISRPLFLFLDPYFATITIYLTLILFLGCKDNLINTLLSMIQFENDRNWFVQFLRSPNKVNLENLYMKNHHSFKSLNLRIRLKNNPLI